MAFVAGKGYKLKVNSIEVGPYMTNVSFALSKDALETTTMGDNARDYIEGLKGGTINLSGRWDGDASASDQTFWNMYNTGGSYTFKLNPTGVTPNFTSNQPGYTGSMLITSYNSDTSFDGVITFTAALQISGNVTRDVSGAY